MTVTPEVVGMCLLIIGARITDVSLGTIRTVAVINGRRGLAWILGFFEVLVWVLVVSKVITEVQDNPLYAVAYALGFAAGNWIGITIEQRVAHGEQVVRVFTRRGPELSAALRAQGYPITEFRGTGRDGPVEMLFIETRRRKARDVAAHARAVDPACYFIVDDVRVTSDQWTEQSPSSWRSVNKRK